MQETTREMVQPLAYRIWDPKYRAYFYTDAQPDNSAHVDRWTGLFDKQGVALYENDIIHAHYDWRLGWIRALILRDPVRQVYFAQATAPDGTKLSIGFFCFAEAYRVGNIREHSGKLVTAREQFPASEASPWWLSRAVFQSPSGASRN